ncbi:GNAT family N-acetyltransferase [Azotosporobacter soli]|uniref:GNAT family N-acetyltransferase n=1 Tax=Azotosporobacter soli TaxID=3055040 RepID=UPI0031FEA275
MKEQYEKCVQGERIRLRPIQHRDIEKIRTWRNDERVRNCFVYSGVISKEQQENWWNEYQTRDDDRMYVIEKQDDGFAIGAVALYAVTEQSCEFGRLMIGEPSALGGGYALEAVQLLTKFAIEEIGVQRILLEVFDSNCKAISIYEKAGYMPTAQDGKLIHMEYNRKDK